MSRLILVRHGQSIWNLQNRFTGWVDVSLSHDGMQEAARVGQRLADERFDVAFTSALIRAQDTLYEILKHNRHCQQYVRIHETEREWYEHFTPTPGDASELKIYTTWRLNERYYGDLQGIDKDVAVLIHHLQDPAQERFTRPRPVFSIPSEMSHACNTPLPVPCGLICVIYDQPSGVHNNPPHRHRSVPLEAGMRKQACLRFPRPPILLKSLVRPMSYCWKKCSTIST